VLGTPTGEQQRVWDALSQGVEDAIALIRPGAAVRDACRRVAAQAVVHQKGADVGIVVLRR
jgi:Xaa-Pro aminopeptidase